MLTKDLLRFRLRNHQLYPTLIDVADGHLLELAQTVISFYQKSIGLGRSELDKGPDSQLTKHPLWSALQKLVEDICIFDDDDDFAATRWDWLSKAQEVREEPIGSWEEFRERLTQVIGKDFAEIKKLLYGDLPENRKLRDFQPMPALALLHRYNCAQVQGLILHAKKIQLRLFDASLLERRNLFRMIKFHRLLVQVTEQTDQELCCEMSGPLTIFDNAQSYGMRMSTFFPYVLQCSKWQLTAEVKVDKREGLLKVDQSAGIKSHYKATTGHIPEEFALFCSAFNGMDSAILKGWKGVSGDSFVHLGQQSYCFPDFKFTHEKVAANYLELFHRWHQGQILQRLGVLQRHPMRELIIGVCRSLRNNDAILKAVDDVTPLGIKIFWFREFPTPKQVMTQLP